MRKFRLVFLALIIVALNNEVKAQQKALIDSLTTVIEMNTDRDSLRVKTLNRLTGLLGRSNPIQARAYALEAIDISKELGLEKWEARSTQSVGISYAIQSKLDSALIYLETSLDLFSSYSDLKAMARTNTSIGTIYAMRTEFDSAIDYLLNALPIFEELGDSVGLALTYHNLGQMYTDLELPEEALERTLKSKSIYEAIGRMDKIPLSNSAIAQSLIDLDREDEALPYIEEGLEINKKFEDIVSATHLNNMAGRIFDKRKDYKLAKTYYSDALAYANRFRSNRLKLDIIFSLGSLNYRTEDYQASKEAINELLSIIERQGIIGRDRMKANALELLSKTEAKSGNYNAAYSYMDDSKTLSDSLYQAENAEKIAELETIYETEKKEAQIKFLEVENDLAQLRLVLVGIGGILVIAFLSFGFWRYYKTKAEEKRQRMEAMKQELQQYGLLIAEKNKFIATFREDLEEVKRHVKTLEGRKELTQLVDTIQLNTNISKDEEELFTRIEQSNTGFFMELRKIGEDISSKDERLATLVQMDLTNQDIANILHIEMTSVKQAKRRLKKKLKLGPEKELKDFLKSIAA